MTGHETMFSDALQRLNHQDKINAQQIADITGVSARTANRWIAGDTEPEVSAVRLLIRDHADPGVKSKLIHIVTGGEAQLRTRNIDPDLNGDNRVDAVDLREAMQRARESVTRLSRIITDATANGLIDADRMAEISGTADQLHADVSALVQVATAQSRPARRQARALQLTGDQAFNEPAKSDSDSGGVG